MHLFFNYYSIFSEILIKIKVQYMQSNKLCAQIETREDLRLQSRAYNSSLKGTYYFGMVL